ncbi:MAG TPA: biotin--[acetyl-CoA-carboxylase] ligase [bacterium]|nr:biotin--[acetyl-CoA-carboxylase] ligase [bacterium]
MISKIKIIYIEKTGSTQDSVLEYLQNDYFPSLLLVAKIQTSGRGRKDGDWFSPEGGFWATLGISTSLLLSEAQFALLHYFTATLLTRVISEEYDLSVQIKWPNDLIYENKKLAGILIDYVTGTQKNYILIGMGINLNNSHHEMPEDIKSIAISIKDILHKSVSLDDFAQKICFYAYRYFSPITEYNLKNMQSSINEYNQHSQIYGKEVILDDSKRYHCDGINHKGHMQFRNVNNKKLDLTINDLTRVRKIISPNIDV